MIIPEENKTSFISLLYEVNQTFKKYCKTFYDFRKGIVYLESLSGAEYTTIFLKSSEDIVGKGKKLKQFREVIDELKNLEFSLNGVEFYRFINSEGKTADFKEISITSDGTFSISTEFNSYKIKRTKIIHPKDTLGLSPTCTVDLEFCRDLYHFKPNDKNFKVLDSNSVIFELAPGSSVIIPTHIMLLGKKTEDNIMDDTLFSLYWTDHMKGLISIYISYEFPLFSAVTHIPRLAAGMNNLMGT